MLHAALLAAALSSVPTDSPAAPKTPVQQCFESMDGAVYHGDPADRALMQQNVTACASGLAQIEKMHAGASLGPEKLFIIGRILDRAATLSYMGLDDTASALSEVRRANLYFRVAAGLPGQSSDFHEAALANVTLTRVQLHTLNSELADGSKAHASTVALRAAHKQ